MYTVGLACSTLGQKPVSHLVAFSYGSARESDHFFLLKF